jgi:hypothetical protein
MLFVSYYIPPTHNLAKCEINDILMKYKKTIIIGDLNAKNDIWYCKETNKTGEEIEELILEHKLHNT